MINQYKAKKLSLEKLRELANRTDGKKDNLVSLLVANDMESATARAKLAKDAYDHAVKSFTSLFNTASKGVKETAAAFDLDINRDNRG